MRAVIGNLLILTTYEIYSVCYVPMVTKRVPWVITFLYVQAPGKTRPKPVAAV